MADKKKDAQSDKAPGAPEWMVTFSDCMTLLLTFFVLLLSFSSFDEKVFYNLKVIFVKALPSVAPTETKRKQRDALVTAKQIKPTKDLDKGSEKPTLGRGKEDTLKEETESMDFHSRKVFLISSKKIFWGKGAIISSGGRETMAAMASFLKKVPARVVISENRWGDEEDSEQLGLTRAWAVMEYLTTRQGVDKNCFSISASSIVAQDSEQSGPEAGAERVLEIVLLERSIYN
jgi:chemotaxis protein MotB